MQTTTLLVIAAVLLIAWLFLRRRAGKPAEEQQRPARKAEDSAFHAVSIKFGKDACAAAKAATGQRFLAREAPSLPLPGCDAARCECHYRHHKDRRASADRRSPFGSGGLSGATGRYDQERRQGSDRRKDADPDPL